MAAFILDSSVETTVKLTASFNVQQPNFPILLRLPQNSGPAHEANQ
jgi:hypothetical protein